MLSSRNKKKTLLAKGDSKAKATPTSQPPFSGQPFTLQELSQETSKPLDEARQIVGLGIQMGTYEAAGEGLYRMTKEAAEAHEEVANRVRFHFRKLTKYGFLGKEGEEEFNKDMKFLKMEGWEATWI